MHRLRKLLVFAAAATLALLLTIERRGQDVSLATEPSLGAAVRAESSDYELSQAQVFSKALYYVNSQYFDRTRPDPKRMLVGALDFLQRDVPEVLVDRFPERDPKEVIVKVNGEQKSFPIARVDSPWTLRSTMREIFAFIEPRLRPVPAKDRARHLIDVEMTATNGMLYTLDPHSVLLDVDSFKDMRTTTQGKFGGLGIVIELDRRGRLTVKKPMPETPAIRAGLRAKDHIVRINNESTMNMTLQEAVDRLRGDVGSSVDVYVERAGTVAPKKFTIVRDYIRPPAIDPPPRILSLPSAAGQPHVRVGYFRIISFSANTEADLTKALNYFEREKVKGIVMDLRGNPGGLYDQAQKAADAFINSGVLVSMVGPGGTQRKDEHATRGGDTAIPLAVLVNQTSASASEIVAGALKNLDRGVIIGETTFGKGSVQMLFDIASPVPFGKHSAEDKLGLKLTTAQYLTPGDVSIQGVGVTPDIELVRMRVERKSDEAWITLQPSTRRRQESDYEWHLENPNARKGGQPSEVVAYLFVPSPGKERPRLDDDDDPDLADEEEAEEEPDDTRIDYPIELARDLVVSAKSARRQDVLAHCRQLLDKARAEQDRKLSAALEKLGVDWSTGPASSEGVVETSLALLGDEDKVPAGEHIKIRGTVKNAGTTTVYRVRAVLRSANLLFDENEMVFGKIAPGATKTYDLSVKVPRGSLTRTDVLRAEFYGQGKLRANAAEMTLNIEGKPRPLFAYAYQTIDDVAGNRDGRVQKGERVRTFVRVKNIGAGPALRTEAIVRNGAGQEGILISAGRFETKDLAPGATRDFSFVYEVGKDFRGDEYQLELMVSDTALGESVSDKIKIKTAPPGAAAPAPDNTPLRVVRADAALREAPGADASVLGYANAGSVFSGTGKIADFYRIDLEKGRQAFIAAADVSRGGTGSPSFRQKWDATPPLLSVHAPTVVASPVVHIKGSATDNTEVKDLYVRVWNRESKLPPKKVFYLPNRGDKTRLAFETDVPLWPGSNLIQIFAREGDEVQSVQTLVVLARPAVTAAQK
ncbi:MAG: PDZ domain-containing protein [Deltaproteobacteria bacterium]|nr:PDZ domain-containing protein [Deltaproteobacteria bacterium]